MGKGALTEDKEKFEKQVSTHGMPLSKAGASFSKTIVNLGGDPEDPFKVSDIVRTYFKDIKEKKIQAARERKAEENKWRKKNPSLARKFDRFFTFEIPDINFEAIVLGEGIATRAASKAVLATFADKIENMIVASADLSNSDNTDGFLKKTTVFKKGDFSGSFLQVGVSELTMGAIANGMALHGGVIPVCGTFFVFSDFMKPTVRLAALMGLPVKYVWTHDAFRVGEDGPTHQPVEQEAQARLLEQLKNNSGLPSLLVLRPADAKETVVCWQIALSNNRTPSALLLSRQGIPDLPAKKGSTRFKDAGKAWQGAYIVQDTAKVPDVILVGNGSEVATLIGSAEKLRKEKNINVRVVSAPSEGLFRMQSKEYQESVLPEGIPTFGLTAGLPVTLRGLVGPMGKVYGLDHFGYSAPYKVLDEKFGFTAENVFHQVIDYLGQSV
jgi:transketolase